jgi:hypothetical protein
MIASSVCVLSQSEAYAAMATQSCRTLKSGMFYGSMLLGGPASTRLPAAAAAPAAAAGPDAAANSGSSGGCAGNSSVCSDAVKTSWQGDCQGAEAVLLLHAFAYVVLLVVLPLLVLYFVELSLKTNFLRQKQRRQQQQLQEGSDVQLSWVHRLQFSPMVDSTWVRVVVSYACVVGAFYACNAVVTLLLPVSCSGDGRLVFGQLRRVAALSGGISGISSSASASTEL